MDETTLQFIAWIILIVIVIGAMLIRQLSLRSRASQRPPTPEQLERAKQYSGLGKAVQEKRPPAGNQTSLLVTSSHWREEFMGNIAWVEGLHDPNIRDFQQNFRAYQAQALKTWRFLGSVYWQDSEIMRQQQQRLDADFAQAVEDILAELREQGWQATKVNYALYHLMR